MRRSAQVCESDVSENAEGKEKTNCGWRTLQSLKESGRAGTCKPGERITPSGASLLKCCVSLV